MLNIYKSQLIEVVLAGTSAGNGQTNIIFPDQPYLRDAQVFGIEFINGNDMTLSPQGNAPCTTAQMMAAYLSLYLTNPDNPSSVGLWLQSIPLSILHRIQNASVDPFVWFPYTMVGQTISWEKSQIILPTAFNNTANVSFLFNVYFRQK